MPTNISLEEKFRATGGKRPYVQRLFGRIARVYDLMNRLMSFGLDRHWRERAARYLALATGETGLDLGAGTADLSIAVIRRSGPGTHMIGMDITPEMLETGSPQTGTPGAARSDSHCASETPNILTCPTIAWTAAARPSRCAISPISNRVSARCYVSSDLEGASPAWRSVIPPAKSSAPSSISTFINWRHFSALSSAKLLKNITTCPTRSLPFPKLPSYIKIMEEAGWSDVHFHYLNGGIVAIHVGTKS